MKLKNLAKKAARLPELSFDWGGVEHYRDETINDNTIMKYILAIKTRTTEHSKAIADIVDAYNQLKDIILETDIED